MEGLIGDWPNSKLRLQKAAYMQYRTLEYVMLSRSTCLQNILLGCVSHTEHK